MNFKVPKCNCPDSNYKVGGIATSRYLSVQINRDWGEGFKGIKTVGGYCLHELSVLIVRGDFEKAFPNGIPKDLPVPPPVNLLKKVKEYKLQNPPRLGDDFS